MEYGWRVAFVILCRTYYGKYGLKTIRDIVSRWAPAKENNTEAYILTVTNADKYEFEVATACTVTVTSEKRIIFFGIK